MSQPCFGNKCECIPLKPRLGEYVDELGVPTQVGQHPQLNLAVVSTDQYTPWTRYKSIPDVDLLLPEVQRDKNICFCP